MRTGNRTVRDFLLCFVSFNRKESLHKLASWSCHGWKLRPGLLGSRWKVLRIHYTPLLFLSCPVSTGHGGILDSRQLAVGSVSSPTWFLFGKTIWVFFFMPMARCVCTQHIFALENILDFTRPCQNRAIFPLLNSWWTSNLHVWCASLYKPL